MHATAVNDGYAPVGSPARLDESCDFRERGPARHAVKIEAASRHVLAAPQLAELAAVHTVGDEARIVFRFVSIGVARARWRRLVWLRRACCHPRRLADTRAMVLLQRRDVRHRVVETPLFFVRIRFALTRGHSSLSRRATVVDRTD